MKNSLYILLMTGIHFLHAQTDMKITVDTNIDSDDVQQIMDFEGINLTDFDFESEALKKTYYVLM